jgi:hypothetical protein
MTFLDRGTSIYSERGEPESTANKGKDSLSKIDVRE